MTIFVKGTIVINRNTMFDFEKLEEVIPNLTTGMNVKETAYVLFQLITNISSEESSSHWIIDNLQINISDFDIEWRGPPNENFEKVKEEFTRLKKLLVFV
jgi:hypothetical protein